MVADLIKTPLDVAFDDPWVGHLVPKTIRFGPAWPDRHADVLQRAVTSSTGTKPVRDMPRPRLNDGFENLLDCALDHTVLDGGDAQGTELPWFSGLRNPFPTTWNRLVLPVPKLLADAFEEGGCPPSLPDASHRQPVDAWRPMSAITRHRRPSVPKVPAVCNPVPQIPIRLVGIRPTPLIQFPLHAEYPSRRNLVIRVHESLLRRLKPIHSLPSFAMWPAFPASDYYEGSAPTFLHHRSPRLACVRHRRREAGSHVPISNLRTLRCRALPLAALNGSTVEPTATWLPSEPARGEHKAP